LDFYGKDAPVDSPGLFWKKGALMNLLKQHQFWAIVMLVAAFFCFVTGHEMTGGKKKKGND